MALYSVSVNEVIMNAKIIQVKKKEKSIFELFCLPFFLMTEHYKAVITKPHIKFRNEMYEGSNKAI